MTPCNRISRFTKLLSVAVALFAAAAVGQPRARMATALPANAPQQAPILTLDAAFPAAAAGMPYVQSFRASGGAGGYKFFESGALPPGMEWVPTGDGLLLRGIPTQAGDYTLRVIVTDASGQQITRDASFHVTPNDTGATVPLNISDGVRTSDDVTLPLVFQPLAASIPVTAGFFYSNNTSGTPANYSTQYTITTAGGDGDGDRYVTMTYTGTLPTGISLIPAQDYVNGWELHGSTTQIGTFPITFTATDPSGDTATKTYFLAVGQPPPVILTPSTIPGSATVGQPYLPVQQ